MPSWNKLIRAILRWISAVLDDYDATRWTCGQKKKKGGKKEGSNEAAEEDDNNNKHLW